VSDSFAAPWTVPHQAPLSLRFPQARILEWVAISLSRRSCQPRDQSIPCRQILYQLGNPREHFRPVLICFVPFLLSDRPRVPRGYLCRMRAFYKSLKDKSFYKFYDPLSVLSQLGSAWVYIFKCNTNYYVHETCPWTGHRKCSLHNPEELPKIAEKKENKLPQAVRMVLHSPTNPSDLSPI